MRGRVRWWLLGCLLSCPLPSQAADLEQALRVIRQVGPEGAGNVAAAKAWRTVVKDGPAAIMPVIGVLDESTPRAANILRTALDAIAQEHPSAIPVKPLEAFLLDRSHADRSREAVFELLTAAKPKMRELLLKDMLEDPSVRLRRLAIDQALTDARKLAATNPKAASKRYQELFSLARDKDQVEGIAERLEEQGVDVNLTDHFNYLTRWMLVGPFDNTEGVGFAKIYAPEKRVDLQATYNGKDGKTLRWQPGSTPDTYGEIDLNANVAKVQGSVAYAYAEVKADRELPVELRANTANAIKIFFNGKEVFAKEDYHHGNRMDQYVASVVLKPGINQVLVKVCQNEQPQSWAKKWTLAFRICDATGGKVAVDVVRPAKNTNGGE